ncbi:MAG: glycosyltransferase [Ignavibacteriae bacterium]|nr:glycosyltransferase [Ignavibacteriota bacterium]
MIDLSIIIVNYNVKEFLLNLLGSLEKASKNISSEIIVVDNNSTDDSILSVKQKYPSVITIENKKNVGFGIANNQGLEIANGENILLINPDTLVKEDTLETMIKFLKDNSEVGITGCKVLNPDGTLQLACRRSFPRPWVSFTKVVGLSKMFPQSKLFAKYNLTYLDENDSNEVDAISGSFMMLKKEVYEKVGGFDKDFFMYGEDLDLCYRIQQAGYKVFYVSTTEIIHYKGESTKRSTIDETKVFYGAMQLFVRKHLSSSILVGLILQFAILVRKLFAFANVNKLIVLGVVLDLVSFLTLIKISESLYSHSTWEGFPEIFVPWVYIVPAISQIIISAIFGSYKRNTLSVLRSIISLFLGLVFITSITFFFKQFAFSRAVVLMTYGFSFVIFSLWRIILKIFFLKKENVFNAQHNTVLVGTDNNAITLADKLKKNLTSNYNLIGLIGLEIKDIGNKINDHKVIGSIDNLKKVLVENKISKVIFSSESIEFNKVFSSVAESQGENVDFLMSGSELDYMVGKSTIAQIENVSLLKIHYNISTTTHKIIKRFFDLTISIFALLFLFPFVYVTRFVSSKNSEFTDAILQLPKVLIGEMSLVGSQKSSYHSKLYLGKPGVTGLWFTETNNSNNDESKRQNLFYAKNQNIWLDLEIIGKSIAKYFLTRGNNG